MQRESGRLSLFLKIRKVLAVRMRNVHLTHSGSLTSYLNITIERDRAARTISLGQQHFIEQMNLQFRIPVDTSVVTPMQENLKLLATEEENVTEKQLQYVRNFPYRRMIGVIIYLNACTRPTVSYSISVLASFNSNPTFLACKALVRLAQFLYNTREDKLTLGGFGLPMLTSFCDSDWGGCINTRYSISGHIVFMGNGPVTWYSKR